MGWKIFLLINVPFYWFDQKQLFKQILIFLRVCHFSNTVRKTNGLNISVLISEIVIFCLKRDVLWEYFPNCFKTTEKNSLAICGSHWEKNFFVNIWPFLWFDQKLLFKQIQIFLRICPFTNMLRKTNFLSILVLVSEIVTFLTKKKSSLWISQKMLQTTERHSLAVWCSFWGEKNFFFNVCPLLLVWSKINV